MAGVRMVAQVRPRHSRRAGHLYNGRGQQTVVATDARVRHERFSFVVAGWTTHRFSIQSHRHNTNLDHAGRRYSAATVNSCRSEQPTELELEVRDAVSLFRFQVSAKPVADSVAGATPLMFRNDFELWLCRSLKLET